MIVILECHLDHQDRVAGLVMECEYAGSRGTFCDGPAILYSESAGPEVKICLTIAYEVEAAFLADDQKDSGIVSHVRHALTQSFPFACDLFEPGNRNDL